MKLKIKGTRFLLLRNPENLKTEQIPKLDRALRLNEPLLVGWYLKEELSVNCKRERVSPSARDSV